jgi:hypothetical protein
MAKSRADGTPAKGSANKKVATPAKKSNARTESPERRVTRSSPRRGTLSTKAQEAAVAAEKVQAGRVTKKASPKKASPAKTEAQTPVKKTASPEKAETQTPPEKRKPGRPRKSTAVTKVASPEKLTKAQLDQVYAAAEAWELAEKAKAAPPAKPRGKKLNRETATQQGEQMPTHVVYGSNRATVSRILAPLTMEKGPFAAARMRDPPADRSNGIPVPRDHEKYAPVPYQASRRGFLFLFHSLTVNHPQCREDAFRTVREALGAMDSEGAQGWNDTRGCAVHWDLSAEGRRRCARQPRCHWAPARRPRHSPTEVDVPRHVVDSA